MARIRTINKTLHARLSQTTNNTTPDLENLVDQAKEAITNHKLYLSCLEEFTQELKQRSEDVFAADKEDEKETENIQAHVQDNPETGENEEDSGEVREEHEPEDEAFSKKTPIIPPRALSGIRQLDEKITSFVGENNSKLLAIEAQLVALSEAAGTAINIEKIKETHTLETAQLNKDLDELTKQLDDKESKLISGSQQLVKQKDEYEALISSLRNDLDNLKSKAKTDEVA
jgi:chromosome segregation ATPase